MKYLQKFLKNEKRIPFQQSEIDEIEDILLTYLESDDITVNGRHRFVRINNSDEIKNSNRDSKLNSYYISTEHPYHDVNRNLYDLSINIWTNRPIDILKIINNFTKRISDKYICILLNSKHPRTLVITYGGFYGKDNVYDEGDYIVTEYSLKITKIE